MRIKSLAKVAVVALAGALLAMGVVGCSSVAGSNEQIAASVDGVNIKESEVTAEIDALRASSDLTDDDDFAQVLSSYSMTPESLRQQVIDQLVQNELIRKAAKENNITIDESEIDTYVEQTRSSFDSDEDWNSALEQAGLTEEKYRENIELSLMQQQVMAVVCADAQPTDDEVLQYASMYATYAYNGAKKSSHILFDANDTDTAENVLSQLKAGTLNWEDAVSQYSKDTSSAADGGNVGWDCLTTFVTEYSDGLASVEPGQMSDLVTSEYGIHIIKCTDEFNAPDEITSLDQMPSELVDSIRSMASSYAQQNAFQEWLTTYKENSNVVVNDMPQDVSYNVDMSAYQTDSSDSDSADEATDGNTAAEGSDDSNTAEATNTAENTDTSN